MRWCEANGVDYVLGLAKNTRLVATIAAELEQARERFEATKQPARVFAELRYRTLDSWSRERRVVAKAEHLAKGANPRFVVTSLTVRGAARRSRCTRRTTAAAARWRTGSRSSSCTCSPTGPAPTTMRANQVRLFFSSIAYVLLEALRRLGLAGTELAECAVPDDPAEAAEDRGAGAGDGAEGVGELWRAAAPTPRCSGLTCIEPVPRPAAR